MRERQIILIIGTTVTGKTYFLGNLIKSKKLQKILVYDINREKTYQKLKVIHPIMLDKFKKGKRRIIDRDFKTVISCMLRMYRNGILILDDLDRYSQYISQDLQSLLIGHRHVGLDIICVFHSLARPLPVFYENCNTILLKKTSEQPSRAIYKLPNVKIILEAFESLQKTKNQFASVVIKCR